MNNETLEIIKSIFASIIIILPLTIGLIYIIKSELGKENKALKIRLYEMYKINNELLDQMHEIMEVKHESNYDQ